MLIDCIWGVRERAKGKVTPGFGFEQLEKWNCHLLRWGSLREEQVGEGRNLVLDVL